MPRKRWKAEILDEYDFRLGVRGKYATHNAMGTNLVVLDSDVAEVFRDSQMVNEVLREVAKIVEKVASRASG